MTEDNETDNRTETARKIAAVAWLLWTGWMGGVGTAVLLWGADLPA